MYMIQETVNIQNLKVNNMRNIIFIGLILSVSCTTTKKVENVNTVKIDSAKVTAVNLEKDSTIKALQSEITTLKSDLVNIRLSIAEISSTLIELENVKITENEYNDKGTITKSKTYEKVKNTNKTDNSKTSNVDYTKELRQKYDSLIRIQDTHVNYLLKAYTELELKISAKEKTYIKQKKTVAIVALIVFLLFVGALIYVYIRPTKTFTPEIKLPIHPLHRPKVQKP